jgi:hypothetical protein
MLLLGVLCFTFELSLLHLYSVCIIASHINIEFYTIWLIQAYKFCVLVLPIT